MYQHQFRNPHHPHQGNERFFFAGPLVGGLLGGFAGGLLGGAIVRPRPFYPVYPPFYGPYGGFGPGSWGGPFFY